MKVSILLALLATVWTGTAMEWDEDQHLSVELGTKAVIACRCLRGNSSDAVWYLNGKKLTTKEGITISEHAAGYSILTIDRVEESHNGMGIICFRPWRIAYHRLTVLAHLPRGFPMIDSGEADRLNGMRSRRSDSGDSVRLPCHATGDPTPDVTWYKDSAPIDWDDERYSRGSSNHDLFIRKVQPADNGMYECVARNTHGMVNSKPFELYVNAPREPTSWSTLFTLCFIGIIWIITVSVALYKECRSSESRPTSNSIRVNDGSDSRKRY